jgi:hypothetical protein
MMGHLGHLGHFAGKGVFASSNPVTRFRAYFIRGAQDRLSPRAAAKRAKTGYAVTWIPHPIAGQAAQVAQVAQRAVHFRHPHSRASAPCATTAPPGLGLYHPRPSGRPLPGYSCCKSGPRAAYLHQSIQSLTPSLPPPIQRRKS